MLLYRFPDQQIVSKNGFFKEVQDAHIEGFLISDFNNQIQYIFEESDPLKYSKSEKQTPFIISKEAYLEQAKVIISHLKQNTLEKLVYSRIKSSPIEITGLSLFHTLEAAYPNALVYYFQDPKLGQWIGATPEILLKGKNTQFESMSLAGTKKADETCDWGEKEMKEHDFVSQFIRETLLQHNARDVQFSGPKTIIAGPLAHLRTDFFWKSSIAEAWQIAIDLHPTPAVCGTPRKLAKEWISSNENHERELYAGIIGIRSKAEMNLFVNLRCAQIQGNQIFLYVGGGLTKDSDPEKEWEETENKSKTLLNLL